MKFSINDFFSKCDHWRNGKLHFLCSDSFLISVSKIFGFEENLIDLTKILSYKQQSFVLHGGFTAKYFNLEKGARQGDPISAYPFLH